MFFFFFFFNDTATTEIYTLSLHDALPIYDREDQAAGPVQRARGHEQLVVEHEAHREDRKSTRLNSSHSQISYAVFCLKKKNIEISEQTAAMHSERAGSKNTRATLRDTSDK